MSAIGPELPPHLLAKRKRQAEEQQQQQAQGNHTNGRAKTPPSDRDPSKRRRVIGPAPPPAPLDERPPPSEGSESDEDHRASNKSHQDSDDSDDDFGPSLPPSASQANPATDQPDDYTLPEDEASGDTQAKPQRDEWMIVPPKQDDLSARMDPTKIRARGFNTAKGAKGRSAAGGAPDNALWTETPEEKRRRLEEEMLGVRTKGEDESGEAGRVDGEKKKRRLEDQERARRIKEYNEEHRANSLLSQHQAGESEHKQKEDNPMKRAFDYEKDMGGGTKVGHTARREMLNKAAQFGSKFSGGGYL